MSLALSACSRGGAGDSSGDQRIDVPAGVLDSAEAQARGREIFVDKCALCHGIRADGRGVRRQGLSGSPANFQSAEWRAAATPKGVYRVLRDGERGTSMPAWPTLTAAQKWDVVSYVLSVSEEGP